MKKLKNILTPKKSSNDSEKLIDVKVVCIGSVVGKTCMLISFAENRFPDEFVGTVFDNYTCCVLFENKKFSMGLWDTSGIEDYDKLRPLSYPDTDICIICFSLVHPCSYDNVKTKWVPECDEHMPDVPKILVGTMLDLREDPKILRELKECGEYPVTRKMGEKLAKRIGARRYHECSAKTQKDTYTCLRLLFTDSNLFLKGLKEVFHGCIEVFQYGKKKKLEESKMIKKKREKERKKEEKMKKFGNKLKDMWLEKYEKEVVSVFSLAKQEVESMKSIKGVRSLLEQLSKSFKKLSDIRNKISNDYELKEFVEFGEYTKEFELMKVKFEKQAAELKNGELKFVGLWENCKFQSGKLYENRGINRYVLVYSGEFANGKFDGRGKTYYKDGTVEFYGKFKNGLRHGSGISRNKKGEIVEKGIWRDGEFVQSTSLVTPKEIDLSSIEGTLKEIMFDSRKEIDSMKYIAQGSWGKVFKIRLEGKFYALKHFINQDVNERTKKMILKEIQIITTFEHQNIIKIEGVCWKNPLMGVITQLYYKSVHDLIKDKEIKTFEQKVKVIYETAIGMEYLVVNRWDNVMLSHPFSHPLCKVKIIDFGTAKVNESFRLSMVNTITGTRTHVAPEVLDGKGCYKSDVFSFAIMIYMIFFETTQPYFDFLRGHFSEQSLEALSINVKKGLRPKLEGKNVDPDKRWIVDLMKKSWGKSVKKRPSFSDIVSLIELNMQC